MYICMCVCVCVIFMFVIMHYMIGFIDFCLAKRMQGSMNIFDLKYSLYHIK